MPTFKRKGYTRADGTYVHPTTVRTTTSGKSRGRKTGGPYASSKGYKRWITRSGKLGGPGFLSRSKDAQHQNIRDCVSKYGYRSCLGSIMVLNRSRSIKKKHGDEITALRNWTKNTFGGKGSFTRSKKSRRPRS